MPELWWEGCIPHGLMKSDLCFCVITWICVCSCLICHKENTKATWPTKAYAIKPVYTELGGVCSIDSWSLSF